MEFYNELNWNKEYYNELYTKVCAELRLWIGKEMV